MVDSDSDDLKDDIEDVNASYSDYSVTKGGGVQSTQNTTRSGGNSSTGSSGGGPNSGRNNRKNNNKRNANNKKKNTNLSANKSSGVFQQLFSRFTRMINKNTVNDPIQAATSTAAATSLVKSGSNNKIDSSKKGSNNKNMAIGAESE